VPVGNVTIGGGAPVVIQSMTNTDTADIEGTLQQVYMLAEAGCEVARIAAVDENSVKQIGIIKRYSPLPLVADVQFDYRLALLSIEEGVDKVRINPGNIGGEDKLKKVALTAKDRGIPIRIGVNTGSISTEMLKKYGGPTAGALVESALRTVDCLERCSFYDMIVSLKASSVTATVEAYEEISSRIPYPLHLGVTEAGKGWKGIIKSSVGIGSLLLRGIGDTIRVSLTGDPLEEIYAARDILQASEVRYFGPDIVSCPTCSRATIDVSGLVDRVEEMVKDIDCPVKIAVMGCPVNGPGEARHADIGISGGEGFGIVFKEGKVTKKVNLENLCAVLETEIREIVSAKEG